MTKETTDTAALPGTGAKMADEESLAFDMMVADRLASLSVSGETEGEHKN